MDKLKRCPFCGGEVVGVREDKVLLNGHRYWRIYHLNPGCVLTDCIGKVMLDSSYSTRKKAVAAWNHRTPDIVYCRDCQYSRQGTIYPMCLYCYNTILTDNGFRTDEDDFCSYGQRRLESNQH